MTVKIYATSSYDYYGLKFLGMILLMIVGLAYASFYLTQNYMSNSFIWGENSKNTLYFLESTTLKNMYQKNKMDYISYQNRVDYFTKICKESGYKVSLIYTNKLDSIDPDAIVIALDMMSLEEDEINDITEFVSSGGKLLFNFRSGFLDQQLHFQKENLVAQITPLSLDPTIEAISYDKNSTGYMTLRLLSPLTSRKYQGEALELTIYDVLPIFSTPKYLQADAYLTNWTQTSYLNISTRRLKKSESGLIWHGAKEKGKWIYFNFPSYVFLGQEEEQLKDLFLSMLDYLENDITVKAYPYVDTKNVIFVSQDSEYKFENIENFSNVAKKNNFPVTAFCVAKLALKYKDIMKRISSNEYLEIGSHSLTHKKIVGLSDTIYKKETVGSKKILEEVTGKSVIGFRPPREEIDDKMIGYLEDGGFKYILGQTENRLAPKFRGDIMLIPRHGTDDYSYLVNLDWNATQILDEMQQQAEVLSSLNGIYTLSVHTHLMSYGTNINIEDKFFQYINKDKEKKALNGEMLYNRIISMRHFSFETKLTPKKLIITLSNNATKNLENLKLEVNVAPGIKLLNIESEIIGFDTKMKKENEGFYTISIKEMQPKSQVVLFVNYEQN